MLFREAIETEYKVIAGFQQKMALETENYQLNIDIVLKGVQAVFDDSSKGKYYIVEDDEKVILSIYELLNLKRTETKEGFTTDNSRSPSWGPSEVSCPAAWRCCRCGSACCSGAPPRRGSTARAAS